jgi:hypothetical protein
MSELTRFYGLVIALYYNDHGRPHIHVRPLGRREGAKVDVRNGEIIVGKLRRSELDLVRAWLVIHRQEVFDAWNRAQSGLTPGKIAPLQ